MDSIGYTTLTRQSGLMREMDVVAHNLANISTTGFRREGVIFSEYVAALQDDPSLSMSLGNTRRVDLSQAGLSQTGGSYDLGIQGEGFFQVQTADGPRLTRAGAFTPNADGTLVTAEGHALLDAGGTAVVAPPDARSIAISQDGTLSADGVALAQIGLWQPADPLDLVHVAGTMFRADGGVVPAEGGQIMQGMLEDSNVEPVTEIARMIAVQRAYELGQSLLDREDARVRAVIQTLGQ
ncbi:MAG: flagellar hook-basal body complex protein [Rhodobacteraceae bacterium]|jgi:flagellar basal-body rod protein FlgF|nr:flagellar hook-basal body complex protein [Paracoccaceae bacterium]